MSVSITDLFAGSGTEKSFHVLRRCVRWQGLLRNMYFLEFLVSQLQHCGRHRFDPVVWSICTECSAMDITMWQETSEDDDDELVADQPSRSYSSTADVTGASSSVSAGVRLHVRV